MDWNVDIIKQAGSYTYKYPQEVHDFFKKYQSLPSPNESDIWPVKNISIFLLGQYEVFNNTPELKGQFNEHIAAIKTIIDNTDFLLKTFDDFKQQIEIVFKVPTDQGNADIVVQDIPSTNI